MIKDITPPDILFPKITDQEKDVFKEKIFRIKHLN